MWQICKLQTHCFLCRIPKEYESIVVSHHIYKVLDQKCLHIAMSLGL
jgi:hypothetical protein